MSLYDVGLLVCGYAFGISTFTILHTFLKDDKRSSNSYNYSRGYYNYKRSGPKIIDSNIERHR